MKIETVPDLLKLTRQASGMTQEGLGKALDYSRATISKWETGEKEIRISDFWRWIKTTEGQDMMISFMCAADIISSVPAQIGVISWITQIML